MDAGGKGAEIKSVDSDGAGAALASTSGVPGVIDVVKGASVDAGASVDCGASLAAGSGAGAGGVNATSWAEMAAIVSPVWESTTTVAGGPVTV